MSHRLLSYVKVTYVSLEGDFSYSLGDSLILWPGTHPAHTIIIRELDLQVDQDTYKVDQGRLDDVGVQT